MPIKQKSVKLQNLNTIDTFIQENGDVSEYFNVSDFPQELSTGRSSFLILGSEFLKQSVSIKIEILDNQGTPIYIEPVYSYEEGNGVRVSIEIYPDVSAGSAKLTILGEVDPNKVDFDIPTTFLNSYNVKYTRQFIVNKEIPNTRPIRFFKRPQVSVKEVFKPKLSITAATSGSLTQTVGIIKGNPVPNTEGRNFSLDDTAYGEVPNYTDQNYGSSPIGNYSNNLGERYTFTIIGAQFSSSMQGGTLTITDPKALPSFTTQSFHSVVAYSSSIMEVLNKNTIAVQKPFGIFNSSSGDYEITATDESLYQIDYPAFRTFTTSSIDFKSFAEITIHTMRTFSGDVNRVAAYTKNNGPYGNWTKIADTPVESPELLIDHNSTTGTNRLGFFRSDATATNYYDVTSGLNAIETSTTVQTASDPEYMANSLFVSSSGVDMLADSPDYGIKLQLKPQYSSSFISGNEYIIKAKLIADNTQGAQSTIKAVFFMSGSAFNMSTTTSQNGYGQPIGKKEFRNSARRLKGVDNKEFEATFTPQRSGTGILQIRFTGGYWHIADLSIRPASETNFSPEVVRLIAPIPTLAERPDELDFAVEFYDVNNNKANTVITTLPYHPAGITFEGENLVIAGNDNTIAGSLFLGGDTTGSGIQMGGVASTLPETSGDGATASGFIRSVQYQGFTSASQDNANTGWMIYSGSVMPDSGDDYSGVGLELVGESGSLRFSTIPSRFEVVADAFFVGSTNTQFISGSGGIIEISSSAFHLSSSGDVIISGSITATEGSIAGWNIVGDKLSGSNATLDAAGAALYKSDQGPETHPYNGYYIDFTPSQANPYYVRFGPDFAVSSSGRLIASGAVIEGTLTASTGFIGNWVIGSNSLHKESSGKFTGMSVIGDTRFFAGATSLAASGSAPFNVKASGDITGSAVMFTGGKIGGFELAASYLRNTDNTVELSSTLPGLMIKDGSGASRVEVKSGSLSAIGGGTQYIKNESFEDNSISAGRNFVSSINSWSFAEVGGVNISLTDRSNYAASERAVSGDVTLDVVVPAGSGNYTTTNTYQLVQIVTASIAAGDTLSFSSVGRFSSSFSGLGKDRALGPQYFRAEYSSSNTGWVPFLPAAQFTASNGYGEYFLGSGQYNSFGASAELPVGAEYIRLILTGSINDDAGFDVEKPLYAADKGTVNASLSGKRFTKTVVGSSTAEYPETEITFDNFSLRSNTRKVEVTQEGILIYNSEDSFFKMTGAGIELKGGSGVASFGTSINRESFTNDSQVAGTLGAPALQAYAANPEGIGSSPSPGNVADYSRGNHVHSILPSTITNVLTGSLIPSASITSFSATSITASFISSSGTASFGELLIAGQPVATGRWAGGTNIYYNGGNVGIGTSNPSSLLELQGSSNPTQRIKNTTNNTFLDLRAENSTVLIRSTGAHPMRFDVNQTERMRIDTDGDLGIGTTNPQQKLDVAGNIAVTGTVDGRDLSTDGSKLDTIATNATADQTITAGSGMTGGGNGNPTLNVIGGTGITANANNITTNDGQIVHDSLSGFIANEHVDHSGVTITAGSGLTGGGTIQATRTLNIGQGTGIAVNADSIATNDSQIVHDNLSGFVANEHIDHSSVSISAGGILSGGGTIAASRTITLASSDVVHDSTTGFVANEHIDHSSVTITAGAGLTGGGTIAATRTLNIGAGTGITVNANDIAIGQAIGTGNSPSFAGLTINGASIFNTSGTGQFKIENAGTNAIFMRAMASDEIYFGSNNTWQLRFTPTGGLIIRGGVAFVPETNNSVDLGTSTYKFGNAYLAGALTVGGSITVGGTVDGRDVASDGTKLDGIEASADVTDTTNVTSAGALMDSELTSISNVKALNQSVISGASPTFGTANFTDASNKRLMTNAQETKLDSVESSADVTDTANVTSAGALMDSEVTNLALVKKITDSDITGSFTAASASFSTRVTSNKAKLDTIETNADVTDTANVTSAGALMDSELTSISNVKALDQSVISGASPTFGTANFTDASNKRLMTDAQETKLDSVESNATADQSNAEIRAAVEAASDSNVFTNADHTKLNNIEASADVTDTVNVTAAGALMDSEVDADIKTLVLPASTTISSFGRTLIDDAAASNARTTLGLGSISTLSSIDISANTNLVGGTNITLSGDTLNVDDVFLRNNADDVTSGTITAGGLIATGNISGSATSTGSFGQLELPKTSYLNFMDGTTPKWQIFNSNSNIFEIKSSAYGGSPITIDATGGGVNVAANLDVGSGVDVTGNITVSGTVDGRDLQTDGTKLDGIESSATADQSNAEIRAAVEAASDSNVFTNADHTKLNAIEANATADQAITAGSGLTGGGTGDVTLNIGAGTGIDVAANAISVDVSDFMANGSNNRILTATGTDAINAEANLTFDGTILSGSSASTGSFGMVHAANKLGVGTQSPGAKLHIKETASSTDLISKFEATGDVYLQFAPANTLKWALTADYPNTNDFNLYNYPNNRNDITVKGGTGNVGIGTTTPAAKLHVNSDISLGADANNRTLLGYSSNTFSIGTRQASTNYLDTVSMTSGKVGIGITSPGAKLEVKGADGSNSTENTTLTDSNGNHLFTQLNGGKAYFKYGPVGIGTDAPNSDLHVHKDAGDARITIDSATNSDAQLKLAGGGNNHWSIYSDGSATNDPLHFYDYASSTSMMILNNGKVGIGRTPANYPLEVQGHTELKNSGRLFLETGGAIADNGTNSFLIKPKDGSGVMSFHTAGTQALYIATDQHAHFSGNITVPSTKTGSFGRLNISADAVIGGNLTVNGTTTTVATTNMVVSDNLIELNNGASSNSNDSGIIIERGSTGNNAIFVWDESADRFLVGTTTATGASTGNLTIAAAPLQTAALTSTTGTFSSAITATTLNTGQGANELYAMNQDVETSDTVTFAEVHLNNTNTQLEEGSGNSLRIQTDSGYVEIGPQNTNFSHFSTDRAKFYFNKRLQVDEGIISSHNEDLVLQRAGTAKVTFGSSTTTHHQDVVIANGEAIGSAVYASGFAGNGWRVDQGITESGKTSAALDNLTVRGTMSIFELQISQVRATNGNLFISSTGKADTVSHNGGVSYTVAADSGSGGGHGFAAGDIIRMQRFDNAGTGGSVTVSDLHVQSIAGTGSFTANLIGGTTAPAKGFEYVRLGSSSDSNRRGGVYLTADDDNAPFIDVFDNITSHAQFNANTGSATTNGSSPGTKVRIGKLDGITSGRFGALPNNSYGMWASGSVFLEGTINAKTGNIGGWGIGENAISSSGNAITIDAAAKRITIKDGSSNDRIYLGETTGSTTFGLKIFDGTGTTQDDVLVDLGATTNRIAGWEVIPGKFQFNNSAGSIALDATNKQLAIYTGSIDTAKPKVVVGNLPTTGNARYGFAVFSGSSAADIEDDSTYAVLITKDKARLAGWDLIPGRLSSGTVADINGNQASIALGTNAINASGTPTDGLFFVSASSTPVFYVGSTFSYVNNVLTAGGWKIGNGQISSSSGNAILSGSGVLSLGSGNHNYAQQNRTYIDGPGNRMSIGQNFTYTSNVLTAGGWTIGNGQINDSNSRVVINATSAYISIGTGTNSYNQANRIYLDGPNARISIGTGFRYTSNALTIDGSATIAGWAISAGSISKNAVKLDSTGNAEGLYVKKTSFSSNTAGGFLGLDGGVAKFNVGNASKFIKFDGNNFTVDAGNFSLDSSGNVTATNANLSGTVTATAGQIGGFGIAAGAISSSANNIVISSTHASMSFGNKLRVVGGTDSYIAGGDFYTGGMGFYDSDKEGFILGMDAGETKFEVADGSVGENFIRFSTAGGGELALGSTNFNLQATGLTITNTQIKTGNLSSATDIADTSTGFIARSDGTVLIKSGGANANFIQLVSGDLKIKTSNFVVDSGNVSMSGNITAAGGNIAGWVVNSGSLSKDSEDVTVTLQNAATYRMTGSNNTTDVIASGLVIKDGDIPILSVVSASKGQTPITSLLPITGSSGTVSNQHKNNRFSTNAINTGWSTSNSNWSSWTVSNAFSSLGGNAAIVARNNLVAKGDAANTVRSATLQKDFDVTINTIMSVSFVVNAFPSDDGKYSSKFGDIALFDQQITVSLFPISNSGTAEAGNATYSGTAAQVRKYKNVAKAQKANITFKNGSVAGYRLSVVASATTRKVTNAPVKLGGWALEDVRVSNCSAPRGAGSRAQRAKPLVELSQDGLLVFSDENNFLRVNDEEGFTLKGDFNAQDLDVSGTLVSSGSIQADGGLIVSSSLEFDDDVGLAMGVESGEARIHIMETVGSSIDNFFTGTTPSFMSTSGSHIAAIKAQVMPYTGTIIPQSATYYQTAFGSFGMRPSYNFPNHALYAEAFHGGDLSVPEIGYTAHSSQNADNDMSASIGIGKIYTYNGSKQYYGTSVHNEMGPLAVNASADNFEEIRWWGSYIKHDTSVYQGPNGEGGALDSGGSNSGGVHTQVGYYYCALGDYHELPTTGSSSSHLLRNPLAMAGLALHNQRGGNFGQQAGWGLAISGSHWNNVIEGPLAVGGNWYPSGSQQLHVTGHILATGNITAYSDIKHKTNIEQITGSIDIVNKLRGVRFDWKKDYIKSIGHTIYGSSETIHDRQLGLIAQEVEAVLPELVSTSGDDSKNVNYQNMVAVLIEANKEQQTIIDDLTKRIEKLESK